MIRLGNSSILQLDKFRGSPNFSRIGRFDRVTARVVVFRLYAWYGMYVLSLGGDALDYIVSLARNVDHGLNSAHHYHVCIVVHCISYFRQTSCRSSTLSVSAVLSALRHTHILVIFLHNRIIHNARFYIFHDIGREDFNYAHFIAELPCFNMLHHLQLIVINSIQHDL